MASTPLQPTDRNGEAVPVLGLTGPTVSVNIAEGVATSITALPAGADPGDVIRVANTSPVYLALGNSGVTVGTSDAVLMAPEYFKVGNGQTHFRAYGITAGVLTVTLMG